MSRRIIDLSVPLQAGIASDPPDLLPAITYLTHQQTAPSIAAFMGVDVKDLPGGQYAAVEQCSISTHNGTHLDAPYHFFPTMDHELVAGGRPAARIDEIPLNWCLQPGVKLDFRQMPDGHVVTEAEIRAEFDRIGHVLQPLEVVLVNTAAGARYGAADFVASGCGIGRDATLWMLRQGVRVLGTDAWSWDAPFIHTRERVRQTGDLSLIWEGHRAGREIGYCHMEKLSCLDQLPSDGFTVSCFPIKVYRGSAGWVRAVAIIEVP